MFRQARSSIETKITCRHSAWEKDAAFLRSFTRWDWSALSVFVSETLPETVWACAQGERIVLSARLLRAYLAGRVPRGLLTRVVWHELVHIWQQAELAAALGPRLVRAYVQAHATQLEVEADLLAQRFVAKGCLFPAPGPSGACRPLCPATAAPAQFWMVGGALSKMMMAIKTPEATLEKLRKYTNLPANVEVRIFGPADGAHETFLLDACQELSKKYQVPLQKDIIGYLKDGSKFNDVRFYNNVTFGTHFELHDDAYINQTHEGDMQFLHSMSTSEGDYELDRRKILRWTKFCLDVFSDEKLRNKRLGEYLFETIPADDLLLPMMASMLVKPKCLTDIKAHFHSNADSVEARQRELAQAIYRTIKQLHLSGVHIESEYYSMRIQKFFSGSGGKGGEYVALGTVCHMLQDSFAGSHARRVYNIFNQDPFMDIEMQEETERDRNATFVFSKYVPSLAKIFIEKKVMPVMLFADYTQQNANRHAYADVFLAVYDVDMHTEHQFVSGHVTENTVIGSQIAESILEKPRCSVYLTTANAEIARDSSAIFLWMALKRKPQKEILDFVESLYPMAEIPKSFPPTAGGCPYEKVPEALEDSYEVQLYAGTALEDLGPNVIESRTEIRIAQIRRHLQLLDSALLTCRRTPYEQYYLTHLNEIAIELHEMEKMVRSYKTEAVCRSIDEPIQKALETVREIYQKFSLHNPLIMDTPTTEADEPVLSEEVGQEPNAEPESELPSNPSGDAEPIWIDVGSAKNQEGSASLFERFLASALSQTQSGKSYSERLAEEFGGENQRGNVAKIGQSFLNALNS